jgi:hypothetical protein
MRNTNTQNVPRVMEPEQQKEKENNIKDNFMLYASMI